MKCKDCSQPAEEGKSRCRKHLDYLNEKAKERQLRNERNGLCQSCGKVEVDWRYKNCEDCRIKFRKNTKPRNEKNKELVKERKAKGLCTRCGSKKDSTKSTSYCQKCYEWNKDRMRKYR